MRLAGSSSARLALRFPHTTVVMPAGTDDEDDDGHGHGTREAHGNHACPSYPREAGGAHHVGGMYVGHIAQLCLDARRIGLVGDEQARISCFVLTCCTNESWAELWKEQQRHAYMAHPDLHKDR